MTLNAVMALILRYFTKFEYDVVVKQLPRFQNLVLIVYGIQLPSQKGHSTLVNLVCESWH